MRSLMKLLIHQRVVPKPELNDVKTEEKRRLIEATFAGKKNQRSQLSQLFQYNF